MAWTEITTVAQLRKNIPMLKDTDISEATLKANIEDAKDIIYDDLSKMVNWDEMELLDVVPRTINRLAQYQAVLLTIIRNFYSDENMIGSEEGENTIYNHYKGLYDGLMKQLETGDIRILDDDNEELEPDVMRKPGLGRII